MGSMFPLFLFAQCLKMRLPLIWKAGKSNSFSTSLTKVFAMASPVKYLTYEGSLTQPGCDEGVTWIVLREPLKMSTSQVHIIYYGIKPIQSNFIETPFKEDFFESLT